MWFFIKIFVCIFIICNFFTFYLPNFLSENKKIDIVLYGHTHRYENSTRNGVLYFNPGESAGMQKGSNAIGILDLVNLEAKRIFF